MAITSSSKCHWCQQLRKTPFQHDFSFSFEQIWEMIEQSSVNRHGSEKGNEAGESTVPRPVWHQWTQGACWLRGRNPVLLWLFIQLLWWLPEKVGDPVHVLAKPSEHYNSCFHFSVWVWTVKLKLIPEKLGIIITR